MPTTAQHAWSPFSDEIGDQLNESRAWCLSGDFDGLVATTKPPQPTNQQTSKMSDGPTTTGALPATTASPSGQLLHRVCCAIDGILANFPAAYDAQGGRGAALKVVFPNKNDCEKLKGCCAIHGRPFIFSLFDCENDVSFACTEPIHKLVQYCRAHPAQEHQLAAAAASSSVTVRAAGGSDESDSHLTAAADGSSSISSPPTMVGSCPSDCTDCYLDIPAHILAPIGSFVERVLAGTEPKALQGLAPPPIPKPCDMLGLTAALKAVECTFQPLVYEPLCDVATVVFSTRCPCCPDVICMVDRVVAIINRHRSRSAGEPCWDPMWSNGHVPCSESNVSSANEKSLNDFSFADRHNTAGDSTTSSIGASLACPCDAVCYDGFGAVSTRMRAVICNIDENDLGPADWPTASCDQIVPHIRFYGATDLSPAVSSATRPLSTRKGGAVMGSREFFNYLSLRDATDFTQPITTHSSSSQMAATCSGMLAQIAVNSDGGVATSTASSSEAAVASRVNYYASKTSATFGLSCEDRTAENVAKFFMAHTKRTHLSAEAVGAVLAECRALDAAPKKRSRSANMISLSPSGNLLDQQT